MGPNERARRDVHILSHSRKWIKKKHNRRRIFLVILVVQWFLNYISQAAKKQNILSDGARENSRDGQQDASKLPGLKLCKGKQIRKKKNVDNTTSGRS